MSRNRAGNETILDIADLVKRREQGTGAFELRVPALRLEAGRFYGVVGPSGSGKSTLLDMLALVLRPTSAGRFGLAPRGKRGAEIGALWQRADEPALASLRKSCLGYVLQSGGLIGFLSVRQNLEMPYHLLARRPDRARIEAMAQRFGVETELEKKPRHLSGGQRQRVAIMRALMLAPALVLADEPTAAVDQVRARQIVAEFKHQAREAGSTIVMVSHDRNLIGTVADELIELEIGEDDQGTAVSTVRQRAPATAGDQ